MVRHRGAPIDGVLLFDKPLGISSNGALQAVRRIFGAAKAGHTGTLDPMATGLLPVAFGEATKFCQLLLDADKRYLAELQLGVETDTGDREGRVVARSDAIATEGQVRNALGRFLGRIEQVPPMHSALKRDGRPLYELARRGVSVAREPRPVTVHSIELRSIGVASVTVEVSCSKGTYIRALATDIGRVLGCGAHLRSLRRLGIGALDVVGAVGIETLQACDAAQRLALLLPPDALAGALEAWRLDAALTARFLQGQQVQVGQVVEGDTYRVYGNGRFIGLGTGTAGGRLMPRRLIASSVCRHREPQCAP